MAVQRNGLISPASSAFGDASVLARLVLVVLPLIGLLIILGWGPPS